MARPRVYIPREFKTARRLVSAGEYGRAFLELMQTKSGHAVAAAAMLSLMKLVPQSVDQEAAFDQCEFAAARGNPYAQFAISLRMREKSDQRTSFSWLFRSANQEFGPALAECGRCIALIDGHTELSRRFLIRGAKALNMPSATYLCSLGIRGYYGLGWRVMGIGLFPFLTIILQLFVWFWPFSLCIFSRPVEFESRVQQDLILSSQLPNDQND